MTYRPAAKSTPVKSRRFAFHHQNEALLFQFLLRECLTAHQILFQHPCPKKFRDIVGNLNGEVQPWQHHYGHVPRLRHYCTLYTTFFADSSSSIASQLVLSIEKACQAALQCGSFQEQTTEKQAQLYAPLQQEMGCILSLLFAKLPDYREDPFILYFLLRHQELCDAVFQQPIVKNTLNSFFPQGLDQALTYMTDWFSKKGFEHLIPSIEEKFKDLETF
jgi:hypothetical protein